ncbi:MATE family efflux transporter [Alteromonas sediminis]|uniref:Multidrug-efflux transporter n=1 Tax=Alteromonas sediminis TaxID=2259342 RepID=A0A3N5YP01_9ALTE|nr:MATE family efflux transporter [Alteromonas sediminis]RPJ67481.1 MATE family efflux transporter [Alteromonas sediminis]
MLLKEAKALAHLAWPLLIAQITQILMGVSDTIMAGHYSATDMAAVAVGFSVVNPAQFFIQGLALALPPIISRLQGAKAHHRIAYATQQLAYGLISLAVLFFLLFPFVPELIAYIPMSQELRPITAEYVQYLCFSLPGFALYQWLRNYCEGLGLTKPTMVITLIGLLINVIANYVLIYGKFGAPALGGAGCGLATAIVFYGMLLATFIYVLFSKRLIKYQLFNQFYSPKWKDIKYSFMLGLPIAMTILFEVSLFAVVALLLAPLGTTIVAAHQIALNFSSLMFMFPMSLGMAVAIRVGYRIGQKKTEAARKSVYAALIFGLAIAAFTASLTLIAKGWIVFAYTKDTEVIALATSLLVFAALFQFSDAIQVISANALRGYKDTTAMFIITFCAYWLCGLPTGVILGRTNWLTDTPMQASGFWIGFIVGLSAAAIMLGLRLKYIQRTLRE